MFAKNVAVPLENVATRNWSTNVVPPGKGVDEKGRLLVSVRGGMCVQGLKPLGVSVMRRGEVAPGAEEGGTRSAEHLGVFNRVHARSARG